MDGIYGPEAVVTAVRLAVLQSMCVPIGNAHLADPESDESVHIPESESQVIDPRIPDWRGLWEVKIEVMIRDRDMDLG